MKKTLLQGLFALGILTSISFANPLVRLNNLMHPPYTPKGCPMYYLFDILARTGSNDKNPFLLKRTYAADTSQDSCSVVFPCRVPQPGETVHQIQEKYFARLDLVGDFKYDPREIEHEKRYVKSKHSDKKTLAVTLEENLAGAQELIGSLQKAQEYLQREYEKQGKQEQFNVQFDGRSYSVRRVIENGVTRFTCELQ